MAIGKKGRVHVEDIVFLIRKDPKKYARVKVMVVYINHKVHEHVVMFHTILQKYSI